MNTLASRTCRWTAVIMLQVFCLIGLNANANSKVDIDGLLQHSGLLTQIEAVPTMVKTGFAQGASDPNIDTDVLENIVSLVDNHFDLAAYKAALTKELSKSLTAKEYAQVMQWYQSDLGKRFVAADANATNPEFLNQLQQQAPKIMADTMRIDFAKRIDGILGLTDRMVDIQTNISAAMYGVIGAMSGQPMDFEMLRGQLTSQLASQRGQMESMMVMITAGTYQAFSQDELAKYEQFINSDAGRQFQKAAFNHMFNWIEKGSIAWVGDVVKIVAEQHAAATKSSL